LRRYKVSDRKPNLEHNKEIKKLDIIKELPPLHDDWAMVSLTFLDPPYWKQAAGKYSYDPEDLGNMSLDDFTANLADIVNRIATLQGKGVIAMTMRPTQPCIEDTNFHDHVVDLILKVNSHNLALENRICCPYPPDRYTSERLEWSKANRKLFVLSREIIVWKIQS
jgi:hypothetical protein